MGWEFPVTSAVVVIGYLFADRRSRRSAERQRLSTLESRVDCMEERLHRLYAYAQELRNHIYEGKPPPPPPWPDL